MKKGEREKMPSGGFNSFNFKNKKNQKEFVVPMKESNVDESKKPLIRKTFNQPN